MKTFHIKFMAILVLAAMLFSPATGFADEGVPQSTEPHFSDNIFGGFEDWVRSTGLPDLKKRVFEKYGLLIKPYFKQGFELSSNIFSAPDLPASGDMTDTSFSFTPGFQALLQHEHGVIGAAYEATFKYFSQFSEQNTQDQSFLIYSDLFPSEQTYLRISEKLDQQGPAAGSSAFEPVDYRDNTFNVVAGVHMSDAVTHEFGYENYDRTFQQDITERFSYNENKYDYRIYRKLNENYRAYIGGRLGFVEFDKQPSRDNFYLETPIGVDGTLPYGITANASVGFHTRNWYDSDRNDWSNVVANVSLQKSFNNNRTALEGGFSRRPVESSFENTTIYTDNMWYTGVKHLITERLRGRASTYYSRRGFNERSFSGTRFRVGPALFVSTLGQVYRSDHIWGMNFGFDYRLRKWLIFHADYNYTRRDSNISGLDYTEHRLSLANTIPL